MTGVLISDDFDSFVKIGYYNFLLKNGNVFRCIKSRYPLCLYQQDEKEYQIKRHEFGETDVPIELLKIVFGGGQNSWPFPVEDDDFSSLFTSFEYTPIADTSLRPEIKFKVSV